MKNQIITTIMLILAIVPATTFGQIQHGGEPHNWNNKSFLPEMGGVRFDALDMELIESQDEVTDEFKETPYRFGIEHEVDINILEEGTITLLENGNRLIHYYIKGDDATSISMNFDEYLLPKGSTLYIWNESRTEFKGQYNHLNGVKRNELAVGLLSGDNAVIELQIPAEVDMDDVSLHMNMIIQGYRSILNKWEDPERGPFGSSGPCNINVNCPEGDDWQIEKKSVAIIVSGGFAVCSGALVNNTNNDGTPYFLTANHCLGGGVSSWVFYFNHEHEDCTGSTGPTDESVSGSELIASNSGSDFGLLLLDENPLDEYDVQYAGWDATDQESAVISAVGIHHPSGDVKKICFEEDAPYHSTAGGAQVWYIDEWEDGVTEGGSSGSPLFDQNHRIIGQLYGGFAACSGSENNGLADWYGRFGVSWDGPSSSSRLRDWLDPGNTGTMILDGYPTGFSVSENDAASQGLVDLPEVICNDAFLPTMILRNAGSETLTSCTISYSVNGNDPQVYSWSGSLEQDQMEEVQLNWITLEEGLNTIVIVTSNPNGAVDENESNDSIEQTVFAFTGNLSSFNVEINLDDYPDETTWEISLEGTPVYSGGPYSEEGGFVQEAFCIGEGCYTFTIFDEFGDGICCGFGDGDYTVFGQNGNIVASGGEFGESESTNICTPPLNTEEFDLNSFLNLYPNPASGILNIELQNEQLKNSYLELLDITGKSIKQIQLNAQTNYSMDISDMSAGVYFVRLDNEIGVAIRKVIIQ